MSEKGERATISSCTIVKNEAHNVDGLLDTLAQFADEIVIVDTGSTDDTKKKILAKAETLSVPVMLSDFIEQPFHTGRAKNVSFRLATKDYTVMVDADFRLGEGFAEGVRAFLTETRPLLASYLIVDEYVPCLVLEKPFIFKRAANLFYQENGNPIHETIVKGPEVQTTKFSGAMIHCQGDQHPLVNPQRTLWQLKYQIDSEPKTATFAWHFLRGIRRGVGSFKKYYFRRGLRHCGWAGFKYAFLVGLSDFLIQFFVGLKASPRTLAYYKSLSPIKDK